MSYYLSSTTLTTKLTTIYNYVKSYFYSNTIKHYNDHLNINNNQSVEFLNFKKNKLNINKSFFVLNNLPDVIHKLLFEKYPYVCQQYFHITLDITKSTTNIFHNLYDISKYTTNDNISHIFIRVNIINKITNLHHVNSIIINKIDQYILFFEPKVKFSYDVNILSDLIKLYIDTNYKCVYPDDIGYDIYPKLQKYDAYCQCYIIYTFLLIINNPDVEYKDYAPMFNVQINIDKIGYFIFYVYEQMLENNYCIDDVPILWDFPEYTFVSYFNPLKIIWWHFYDKNKQKQNKQNQNQNKQNQNKQNQINKSVESTYLLQKNDDDYIIIE